jgi:tetratricopeptide (TPR) repeat protein
VRCGLPQRRWFAWLAFTAVAFLPVHVYTSPMPGNEMLATLTAAAAVALFLAGEARDRSQGNAETATRVRDCAVGLLAGLALLSKYNALAPLAAIGVAALLRSLRAPAPRAAFIVTLRRGLAIAAITLVVAGPYYARNVFEFGTPFMTSHEDPKVKAIEAAQPPGERSLRDFVLPPGPALLWDSSFDAPHVVRSVWGSAYLSAWFDVFRGSQFPRWTGYPIEDFPIHRPTLTMAAFGLVPSALAVLGALVALRGAWAGDAVADGAEAGARVIDLGLTILGLVSLALFVAFAVRVPTFAAVKASYLLNLSLWYGWSVARGAAELIRLGRERTAFAAAAGVVAAAAACSLIFASGLLYPKQADHPDIFVLRAWYDDAEAGREWLRQPVRAKSRHAIELVAAMELGDGGYARASQLLRDISGGPLPPRFVNALATATALSGDHRQALSIWKSLLASNRFAEALMNRGTVRALLGDLVGGRADIERALRHSEEMVPGWSNLAEILELQGQSNDAREARRRAAWFAERAPRRFPYGVGDGELEYAGRGQRWMLVLDAGEISIYRPPRARWGRRAAGGGQ